MVKETNSVGNMLFLVYWNVDSVVRICLGGLGIAIQNIIRLFGNV